MGRGGRPRDACFPNPAPPLPELRAARGAARRARLRRADARLRRPADGAEVARRRDRGRSRRPVSRSLIAGDGPDREALERLGHGTLPRPAAARDGCSSSSAPATPRCSRSSWENFPHVVVEALAVGTPVIATRVGGVAEVLRDGENGLVVEPGDLGRARGRDRALLRRGRPRRPPARGRGAIGRRLRARARLRAARANPRLGARDDAARPLRRVATRYRLPLDPSLARKWDALSEQLELRVLAAGTGSDPRFALRLADRARRPALLRVAAGADRARAEVVPAGRRHRAEPVRGGSRPRWRAAPPARRAKIVRRGARRLARLDAALRLARPGCARARRRPRRRLRDPPRRRAPRRLELHGLAAARTKAASPIAVFTTFSDHEAFSGPSMPVPEEPRAIFVGVLERYKNVHVLAAAWRLVARAGARRRSSTWSDRARRPIRRCARAERRRVGAAARAARARAARRPLARARSFRRRLGGAAAGRDRGVPARPRRDRLARGRDPRHRRGRRQRPARRRRAMPAGSPRRSSGCSPTTSSRCGSGAGAAESVGAGSRRAAGIRRQGSRARRRGDWRGEAAPDGRPHPVPAARSRRARSGSSRRSASASTCACSRRAPTAARGATARSSSSAALPLARRAALLPAAAVPGPAAREEAEAGGDRHAEPLRGGVRLACPDRSAAGRRAARRLADGDASLRLAAAPRARAACGLARHLRHPAGRRRAHDLRVHLGSRARGWRRAGRGVRHVRRLRRVRSVAANAGPGCAAAAVRRRARALQEHRRPRRRLAPRGRRACPAPSCTWSGRGR